MFIKNEKKIIMLKSFQSWFSQVYKKVDKEGARSGPQSTDFYKSYNYPDI